MLLTVKDIAKRLNISRNCVYKLASSRQIACHKLGRKAIRFREEDLAAFLDACRIEKGEEASKPPPRPRLKHLKL
jgi:excisionase family DNA binding protein